MEAARDVKMEFPWKEMNEGPPVPEEQYQERERVLFIGTQFSILYT